VRRENALSILCWRPSITPNIFYTTIIYPIVQIIEIVFTVSQKLFKETGLSIICVSGAISILCLPLYAVAEKWQKKERYIQKKLEPKITKIKSVFTGDERYMILSTYYRQNHYHPVYAMRSTFGLLIQIPFFIAAYSYLSQLDTLKGVSFVFISDLGKPDELLPIAGKMNLLPILMTTINCIAGAIYTRELSVKDKVQLYVIAFVFLLLLYNSPSGLVLYWTFNNIFSLLKNIYFKVSFKFKRQLLAGIFSFFCIIFAFFCLTKYSYISNAKILSYICIFSSVIPWIVNILNKQSLIGFEVKYEVILSPVILLLSILLIWSLFGLFIPSQLIASSPQEFSFIDNYTTPLYFLIITAFQVFGLFVFWPVCIYFLFSTKIKSYFSLIFLAVCFGMIINVFLFPGNYGVISVNFVYSSGIGHSFFEILLNLVMMLIVLFISYILYNKNKRVIIAFVSFCILSLLSISIINIYKINLSFKELRTYYANEHQNQHDITPIFSLSRSKNNVIIIMLDRAISVFIPYIFDESPELKEKYTGFTFYPNTVSFNGYTGIGSPPVFGGYEYTPLEINKRDTIPLVEKHNQALLMIPIIFSEKDFSVYVTDPPYANYNQKSDLSIFDNYKSIQAYVTDSIYTDFWISEHNLNLPTTSDIIKRNMFWYSLHKGLPVLLREPIYLNGNWLSPIYNNSLRLTINGYSVLDYLPRLTEITNDHVSTAIIMTNNTTHEGSFLQAPDYTPSVTITNYGNSLFHKEVSYHINAAAIKRLSDWFDFLKENDVYNNTRIILVSDHGPEQNIITRNELPFNVDQFNPLLMIKDFNASGEMRTDMSFMTNADVPYLSMVGIVDNPINPFTGNEITIKAKEKPQYIAVSGSIHIQNRQDSQFSLNPQKDYYVHENIFNKNNWIRADIYQQKNYQP